MWKALFERRASHSDDDALALTRALLHASRQSSQSVLAASYERLCVIESSMDVFLVFVPRADELVCAYTRGPRAEHCGTLRIRREHPANIVAHAGAVGHRIRGARAALLPGDRAALAMPLVDARGLHGVIYCASSFDRAFEREEDLVRTIAFTATPYAMALEREADRADATFDGLTGLFTPRAFRLELARLFSQQRLRGSRNVVSLWFIDTDRFKLVNDSFGHAVGDRVLQAMAGCIRASIVPGVDLAGRNGGDEFCAVVHDDQKSVAIERAHRFCTLVRNHDFGIASSLSASVGVASFPYDADDANALLEVADAAMYHSKRTGRDRVSFALSSGTFRTYEP